LQSRGGSHRVRGREIIVLGDIAAVPQESGFVDALPVEGDAACHALCLGLRENVSLQVEAEVRSTAPSLRHTHTHTPPCHILHHFLTLTRAVRKLTNIRGILVPLYCSALMHVGGRTTGRSGGT